MELCKLCGPLSEPCVVCGSTVHVETVPTFYSSLTLCADCCETARRVGLVDVQEVDDV